MSGNNGVRQIHMFIRQKCFDLDVQLQFVLDILKCSFWDSPFDHMDAKS